MKIGAVRECWVVRTPVTPPAVRGLIRRNEKPHKLGFPLSKSELSSSLFIYKVLNFCVSLVVIVEDKVQFFSCKSLDFTCGFRLVGFLEERCI